MTSASGRGSWRRPARRARGGALTLRHHCVATASVAVQPPKSSRSSVRASPRIRRKWPSEFEKRSHCGQTVARSVADWLTRDCAPAIEKCGVETGGGNNHRELCGLRTPKTLGGPSWLKACGGRTGRLNIRASCRRRAVAASIGNLNRAASFPQGWEAVLIMSAGCPSRQLPMYRTKTANFCQARPFLVSPRRAPERCRSQCRPCRLVVTAALQGG